MADPDALVELPLDEGTGTVAFDVSGTGNDGILQNGASFEADTPDGSISAVRLDGLDDFVELGPVDVNGSGLTLATWFNADIELRVCGARIVLDREFLPTEFKRERPTTSHHVLNFTPKVAAEPAPIVLVVYPIAVAHATVA